MSELNSWDSFYVIVGSAAGALIGLQFVVMTLVAQKPPPRASEASPAFATPTIVHFSAALLLSVLVRVPWHSINAAAIFWGLVGLCGVVYMLLVARRMRLQGAYKPVFEDWLFHVSLPLVAYLVLVPAAFAAPLHEYVALFGVGAAALLLLFIGIHNAWDAVAYHIFVHMRNAKD